MRYLFTAVLLCIAMIINTGCDEPIPFPLSGMGKSSVAESPATPYVEVQLIYLEPEGTLPNEDRYLENVALLESAVIEAQTFFAEQMQMHGYDRKTFSPDFSVKRITLPHSLEDYESTEGWNILQRDLNDLYNTNQSQFAFKMNLFFIPMYQESLCSFAEGGGNPLFGKVVISNPNHCWTWKYVARGMCFAMGLKRDFRYDPFLTDGGYLMSDGDNPFKISKEAAEWLSRNLVFNSIGFDPIYRMGINLHDVSVELLDAESLQFKINITYYTPAEKERLDVLLSYDYAMLFGGIYDDVIDFTHAVTPSDINYDEAMSGRAQIREMSYIIDFDESQLLDGVKSVTISMTGKYGQITELFRNPIHLR